MNDYWKAVEVAVPVNMHPALIKNLIIAEIHLRARRAGEAVADLRIGAPREPRGDFIAWSASYLPAPQMTAA
ncbi:hypothetical protein [Mycolicibacterium tusciae]|uniref:hypothetical protein n=1 Tax=Mycolicibacterium tusciae TaxID=75922 RepID=UPI00024A3E5A|nr:hypothetical protein [Mycolicibacterium tusciae]